MTPSPKGRGDGRTIALAVAISAAGGLIAHIFDFPAAFLCGGALAVACSALLGFRANISNPIRNFAFVIIGMSMGSSVARDTIDLLPQWPMSLAALVLALMVIIIVPTFAFHKLMGIDRVSAFLSSCPGHLSFIIGLSEGGHGDTRRIATIQSMRLLVLTIAVPLFIRFTAAEAPPLPAPVEMSLFSLAWLAIAATLGGYILQRLKVPAGFVLGAMTVSTIAKLSGWFEGTMPPTLVMVSFIIMGALIGSRFAGITIKELRGSALAGLFVTSVAIGVVSLAAFVISGPTGIPFGQLWIALAPGGLETMGALGFTFGYDSAFIAGHHAIRLMILGFVIPAGSLALTRRAKRRDADYTI